MTLYRKYRPQTIDELDLETVRETLYSLSKSLNRIPHAFLFAGPKGTGKTSAARILAKVINCEVPVKNENGIEPCNKCGQCLAISNSQSMDVVEIDAASNRGIDDIRLLRENIVLAPGSSKKRVYIMDEAHMLTTEAFNAFLKTLEEPPQHTLFILATTDPERLPGTVRSRLALVSFPKAGEKEIARQLSRVVKGERLKVSGDALFLISKKADGSFRDAVKALEMLSISKKNITKSDVERFFYASDVLDTTELLGYIFSKEADRSLLSVRKYIDSGGSARDLIDRLQEELRVEILNLAKGEAGQLGIKLKDAIFLVRTLMDAKAMIPKAVAPELPLELAIIELCGSGEEKKLAPTEVLMEIETEMGKKKVIDGQIDNVLWRKVLDQTRTKNVGLEAVLRTARPIGVDGNTVNLAVYYRFHKERLEVESYRRVVEGVVGEVMGIPAARLVCVLEDPPKELVENTKSSQNGLTRASDKDILEAAKEIFGE